MLLSLRADHKSHLQFLTQQATQTVVDFCKLAIDYLHKGPNLKLYETAATKLSVDVQNIQNCIYGLVNLLVLATKHKLNEADFRDSIITLGFTEEHQTVLYEFYKTKCNDVNDVLKKLTVEELHYKNIDWRFEVQVASRSLLHQAVPLIAMDLQLQNNNTNEEKHILLQTDPNNLVRITNELEKALMESQSRRSRRIERTFIDNK